ncbi:PIG-L deacetylase family protein [Cryobacterium roopkundense]|uniref:LmbE family N-acetylglucosaminyl deacetylase n=2 Tax=Cryobacterium roopkundense TaxID=1001240 RepID=A0A7W8ZX73_9MICO|nr:hypothetical protein [Cryobacterium roopkundense]MBB5641894.1 LmbE family N-acetylglucosaminyl deacetylase [Cryobacterium roopkundense]
MGPMVMSGSGESIVFVHGHPGDESWLTGGTIARLNGDGATSLVLYEADAESDGSLAPAVGATVTAALGELGVTRWRGLPAASAAERGLADALTEALAEEWATAVVIGTVSDALRLDATAAAHAARLPVFLCRRVADAAVQRLVAIDVSDHLEQKLRALAHFPSRWQVEGTAVTVAGGPTAPVSGSEAFARLDPPRTLQAAEVPTTMLNRVLAGVLGVLAGVTFGVLGTLAHQSAAVIGPVTIPVGLILALVAVSALLVGLRLVLGNRTVALLAATGLLITIFLLSLRGAGGSVLVPAGLTGTLWTVVPALVAALVLAWPKIPTRR